MKNTKKLVVSAILVSWILVLGMTQLGFIPIGPIKATTLHIPVLIAAIIYDWKMGMGLGLIFGLYSLFQNMTRPTPLSFAFLNPLVSILPRLIFPLVAAYLYKKLKNNKNLGMHMNIVGSLAIIALIYSCYKAYIAKNTFGLIIGAVLILVVIGFVIMAHREKSLSTPAFISAILASVCHTLMVMGLIYLIYLDKYAFALGIETNAVFGVVMGVVILNGVPEAVLAGVIVGALARRIDDFSN